MALNRAQEAFLDTQLGPGLWQAADLEERIVRTGNILFAVREVLDGRLALLIDQPANLSVPGEISIGTEANIRALRERLALLPAAPTPAPPDDAPPVGGARVILPDRTAWRR